MSTYDTILRPLPQGDGTSRQTPREALPGRRKVGAAAAALARSRGEPLNEASRTTPTTDPNAGELLALRERFERLDRIVAGLRTPPGVRHEHGGSTMVAGIEMLCASRLREAGWTDALIERHLGEPDLVVPNPHRATGGEMRLYGRRRVEQAGRAAEHADATARLAARRAARTGASGAEVRAAARRRPRPILSTVAT